MGGPCGRGCWWSCWGGRLCFSWTRSTIDYSSFCHFSNSLARAPFRCRQGKATAAVATRGSTVAHTGTPSTSWYIYARRSTTRARQSNETYSFLCRYTAVKGPKVSNTGRSLHATRAPTVSFSAERTVRALSAWIPTDDATGILYRSG